MAPALTVGNGFTVICTGVEVAVQPAPFVTLTEYEPAAVAEILGVVAPFDHR